MRTESPRWCWYHLRKSSILPDSGETLVLINAAHIVVAFFLGFLEVEQAVVDVTALGEHLRQRELVASALFR